MDRAACLALFDGNVPDYFHATEREAFGEFLESSDYRPPRLRQNPGDARFYVLQDKDAILGCGGWYLEDDIAGLTWGIVSRAQHGKGLGRVLLQERLKIVRKDGRAKSVRVRTTPKIQGFFEHFGFRLVRKNLVGVVDEVPLVELLVTL